MTAHFKKVYSNHIMLISIFLIVFIISVFFHTQVVNARESVVYEKTFLTIEIEDGQTLTSIANTYAKPGQDMDEYISEVQSINNLNDTVIHTGCYLVVPTYQQCQ